MRVKDFLKHYYGYINFITNSYLTEGRCDDETTSQVFECWNDEDKQKIMNWFESQNEDLVNAFIGTMTILDSVHGMSEEYYKRNPEHKHTHLQVSFTYK